MLRLQMAMEDSFHTAAGRYSAPAVIICDRGIMDSRAFMNDEQWRWMEQELGFSVEKERDECAAPHARLLAHASPAHSLCQWLVSCAAV